VSPPETCLLCESPRRRVIFDEHGVPALRCRECRHVYSGWEADPDYPGYWDNKIADPDVAFWRDAHAAMYREFMRRFVVEPKGRLLDVGCGFGFFVEAMAAARPDWDVHGYEISPDATRYARETLGLANIGTGRLEDASFPDESFAIMTLWDVLEHLKQPDSLLATVHRLLEPGGLLFLHTPNAQVQVPKAKLRRLLHGMDPSRPYLEVKDHLHLYAPKTLRRLLERNGFDGVGFVHLPAIQHAEGYPEPIGRWLKNAWAGGVRVLDGLSGGAWNFDALFAVAHRPAA